MYDITQDKVSTSPWHHRFMHDDGHDGDGDQRIASEVRWVSLEGEDDFEF